MKSKGKALKKAVDYEKPVGHKAVGGTLYFSHPKSKEVKKHKEHEKELEGRKASYHAWKDSIKKK